MFYLLGSKHIVETILLLAKPYLRSGQPTTRSSLRAGYLDFLKNYQPKVARGEGDGITWVREPIEIARLIEIFNTESRLDDIVRHAINDAERGAKSLKTLDAVKAAFDRVTQENPEFADLLSFVTKLVFSARSTVAGGGSTSAAVGVMWADIRQSWAFQDIAEFFVHELGHSLMFLDELRYRHYLSLRDAVDPRSFALSAILETKRPLDKVLHSLVVATDVLLAREHWLGHPEDPKLHPPSPVMLDACKKTVESILANKDSVDQLAERGIALVHLCRSNLDTVHPELAKTPKAKPRPQASMVLPT